MTQSRRRKAISATNAVVAVVVALGIAIALNAVAAQVLGSVGRLDLTQKKLYTLSPASVEAVAGLEQEVQVKAFVSPDMPPPYHKLSEQIGDLLEEYAAESGGRMTYQIINPKDDEETEEAAKGYGCEKVGIGQQTEDEVSLRAVYKCVAFVRGEEQRVIRDLKTTGNPEFDNFEYEFTKALLNLRDVEPRTVGFVSGFGGPASSPQFIQQIAPLFGELYGELIGATTVDLSAPDASVPESVDALVLLNPEAPFGPRAKFAIDQFVQRGGSVGWFQSASGVDQEMQQRLMQQMGGRNFQLPNIRKPFETGLGELFGHYGVKVNQDHILDRQHGLSMIPVPTEQGLALVTHPGSFQMTEIDQSLPFTRDIYAVMMAIPASVTIMPQVLESEAIEATAVITTSPDAVRRPGAPLETGFEALYNPTPEEEKGPFVVAAALQGPLPSYYQANPLPEGVSEGDLVKEPTPARIFVVGSGDFFAAQRELGFDQRAASLGLQLMLNAIEWLVQDTKLAEIRGKATPRLIGEVDGEVKNQIQFINILFVPAVFGLIGVFMLMWRRRRKSSL